MNAWHIARVIYGILLLFAMLMILPQESYSAVYTPPQTNREYVALSPAWKFYRGDVANAQIPAFNDTAWSTISLPHTWNNIDGQDGGNNYYRGVGWYRKHYVVPATFAQRNLYLQFDGAAITAEVWVNGSYAGRHQGGFAAFQVEITKFVTLGADNVIAVRVSNAYNADIPPLAGDFTIFGGIHRHVNLLATDKLQVRDLPYAGPGVYLTTSNVTAAAASLQIRTKLWNGYSTAKNVTVKASVVDADMNIVSQTSVVRTSNAATAQDVLQNLTISRPHLWNGLKDPYLYKVFVELWADGRITDTISQPLGFRSFYLDPNLGFFLNGQYLDLHGVNRHNDRLDKGWAISPADQEEDLKLIKEMGATAVRLAHYQHDQHFYDLCDENGLVVWTEAPLVNRITASTGFTNNARQQLIELIRQNYNHPSIVYWGLSNEILLWTGPDPRPLISQLAQLARTEDPTRLVTLAEVVSIRDSIATYPDTAGYNVYFGWYGNTTYNDFAAWADSAHRIIPQRPLAVSEYGAGASINQHMEDPPKPDPAGKWHPEEYQNLFHEAHWKAMKQRNFLWGKFIWNMFDFAVDSRNEGDTPGRNDKGLVTYDRKVKKDAFFWYKANWSSDPFVYLTSRRFQPRTTLINKVKVYSNTDSVELLLNQVSLGTKASADRIFEWPSVSFRNGGNLLEARGVKNGKVYTDTVTVMVNSGTQPVSANRIDAGSATTYRDSLGNLFSFDVNYSGGSAKTTTSTVTGTPDSGLYQSYRLGNFSYRIPVENGSYEVRLRFVDSWWTAVGARVFTVSAEGQAQLNNLDIFKEAGKLKALDKSFYSTVADGYLDLQFVPSKDNATVSAIEVIKTQSVTPTALRYDVGSTLPYTDSFGNVFDREMNYSGGTISSKPNAIGNTPDPNLYRTYRYGTFSYKIPLSSGTYQIVLKFIEPYWGRAGARVFNVTAEGQTQLSNLDIFREAGQFSALDKSFVTTVSDGVLDLGFTPTIDNAVLSAMEIIKTQ